MSVLYNAEEIYRIGIDIEKNGKSFYMKAAERAKQDDVKRLLQQLAGWEDTHIALFERMLGALPKDARAGELHDPDGEMEKYLRAVADSHVFLQKDLDLDTVVRECKDAVATLQMALRFEKDSVVLYATVRDTVPEEFGRDTITRLLQEEIAHVSMIQEQLQVLEE
jgi:rubrerythrin